MCFIIMTYHLKCDKTTGTIKVKRKDYTGKLTSNLSGAIVLECRFNTYLNSTLVVKIWLAKPLRFFFINTALKKP